MSERTRPRISDLLLPVAWIMAASRTRGMVPLLAETSSIASKNARNSSMVGVSRGLMRSPDAFATFRMERLRDLTLEAGTPPIERSFRNSESRLSRLSGVPATSWPSTPFGASSVITSRSRLRAIGSSRSEGSRIPLESRRGSRRSAVLRRFLNDESRCPTSALNSSRWRWIGTPIGERSSTNSEG
ncbi:MAG: hypothetical protein QF760_00820 [Candidatus Thalassarchaeaceae archaeon]|nr:hypothetical protein [Candidatus Thalassarchaeaceae archaeon]